MDIGWKIASAGSAALATIITTKILDAGWKAATGHQPPHSIDEPGVDIKEVIVFALVSGALIGVARQVALHNAGKWYGGAGGNKLAEVKAEQKLS